MGQNEQQDKRNMVAIPAASAVWNGFIRALSNGIVGLETKDYQGTTGVVDIVEGEAYVTLNMFHGKAVLGSLDGRLGDPKENSTGFGATLPEAIASVDHGNIIGIRYTNDEVLKIKGQPVLLNVAAGMRRGEPLVKGNLRSGFDLSDDKRLTYGAALAAGDGFRADVFADYTRRPSDTALLSFQTQVSADSFGSKPEIIAAVSGQYDRKVSTGSSLSMMANGYLRAGSHEGISIGANIGFYKDFIAGMRVGPYIGADTERGVNIGFTIVQPFGR